MASILEIARLANVSANNVLRVVNGEPVSSDVASKVASAIEAIGPPPSARARTEVGAVEKRSGPEASEVASRVDEIAAELERRLPQDLGSIVYEALRVEVQPVSRHMAELDALYKLISARLEEMRLEIGRERNERLEDVALLSELVSEGWRSADRRLARLESMLARLEDAVAGDRNPLHFRFPSASEGRGD
jgi:flagellin-specific chaperone FliS